VLSHVDAVIASTGADIRIGGEMAFYSPSHDFIQVPPQQAYFEPINWHRTVLHELGHHSGHVSRLNRNFSGRFGGEAYAREELVAELCSAFLCAELGVRPTVRHADYLGAWLDVLKGDNRAIFQAASMASKAADCVMGRKSPC
jgi:antirestriction protein ArdC